MAASEIEGKKNRPKDGISDEVFRILVQSVTDYAIYLLDPQGIVTSWNVGGERIKGYSPREAIGLHFSAFYTAEERAVGLPERALAIAMRDGKYEAEGWRIRKDGSRFWASVLIDRLLDSRGKLIGFAKITRDLTERRSAEEALRLSEERFGMLVQGVTDYAIYMLDPGGHISNWNAGGERIKGYAPAEVLKRHFSMFYTEADRKADKPRRALEAAARDGRYEAEGWRVRKDGSHFWAGVVIDAIRDDTGKLLGFAKVTRDLTEKKAAEERLRHSQKIEAIGRLTGGIAHDFNNLLTVIISNTELMTQPHIDEQARAKLIDGVQRAAERGATLTHQLLAFARQQPLRPEPHSIAALIRNFEGMLRRAAGTAVVLDIDLHRGPDFAKIDAPQFEAALLNLVMNARDAMPQGGTITIKTELSTHAERGEGEMVFVTISDTGIGMEAETLARAFEPFFTTKEVGKGTGLGLSQVHGFVEQSGGHVALESHAGAGTKVTLQLPIDAEAQRRAVAQGAVDDKRPIVLVVDDEPDVLDAVSSIVKLLGYHVVTAVDGASALDQLRREPSIEVLFTDVVMPRGVNGVELAREARAVRPTIKVLLASGFPLSALPLERGVSDEFAFISKPYRWAELAERLRLLRDTREHAMAS